MHNTSPVRELLDQEMIVLAGHVGENVDTNRWENTEIVFYLNMYIEDKSLGILVHDFGMRQDYLPATRYSDYDSAAVVLKKLMEEFPGRMDKEKMLGSVKTYFAGLKDSVASSGEIHLSPEECNFCNGLNFDDYRFVYFPAVPGTLLDKASLELTWDYGCYRSDTVAGAFEDVAAEVSTMLEEILDYADDEPRIYIQQALDAVKSNGDH